MQTFCATLSDCSDSATLLAKDFENLAKTLATFITLSSIQLAIRRRARA